MTAAMILAAGFGTRLHPITEWFPKPMVPVGDRPAFEHIAQQLRGRGFGPIVMNAYHRADAFDGRLPPDVTLSVEPQILGTAGGVSHAASRLGDGDVLVWNGDILADVNLPRLLSVHASHNDAIATMLVAPAPLGQGTVGISAAGYVTRLRGKQFGDETRSGNYLGVMLLSDNGRKLLPREGCLVGDFLLPLLSDGAKVRVLSHDTAWVDLGTPATLLEANLAWLRKTQRNEWKAPSASVASETTLLESVVCADATVVGTGALTRSLILPGARVSAPADSIIALPNSKILRVV